MHKHRDPFGRSSLPTSRLSSRRISTLVSLLALVGCGGGSITDSVTFTIGGTVRGLAPAGSLTLSNDGREKLVLSANGAFSFSQPVARGGGYSVEVVQQPEGQLCTVEGGKGSNLSASVNSIIVGCRSNLSSYRVGGDVTGLRPGQTVTLLNNGLDSLTIEKDGAFEFSRPIAAADPYSVTVSRQPTGQTCEVTRGSGHYPPSHVDNVAIECVASRYTVAGKVSGLRPGSVVTLQNRARDSISVSADGPFAFAETVAYSEDYAVTVKQQPVNQTCSVSQGAGSDLRADVDNVLVNCSDSSGFSVGGILTAMQPGAAITLTNNERDSLTLRSNGTFKFTQPVQRGGSYAVAIRTQPDGQNCSVLRGSGIGASTDIENVSVDCAGGTPTYSIGGSVSGLQGGASLQLSNNGSARIAVASSGAFTFPTPVPRGHAYLVTITSQPDGHHCRVVGGSGVEVTANVSSVLVSCEALKVPSIFVSPEGDDAGDGSRQRPFKTLAYATTKLRAGVTLYLRGGLYREGLRIGEAINGSAKLPIFIVAYPDELPIIDGQGLVPAPPALVYLEGSHIRVSGLEVRNSNVNGSTKSGWGIRSLGVGNIVSKVTVHHTWLQGIVALGDYSVIEDSLVFQVGLARCRGTTQPSCNIDPNQKGGWPSCVSVAATYNTGRVIKNPTIQRTVVRDCWGEGISTWRSDGAVIRDNVTYDNFQLNLYLNNATNALVERNIVYNTPNNIVKASKGFTLADEKTDSPQNEVFSSGNRVVNNLFYNAGVCAFCWTQLDGSGLKSTVIANNTVVVDRPISSSAAFAIGNASSTVRIVNSNSEIRNNIFAVGGSVRIRDVSGLIFSNNLWDVALPPMSLDAIGTRSLVGDPLLSRVGSTARGQLGAGYFVPSTGSLALGNGVQVPGVSADFLGRSRKNPPDIGALQR